MSTRHAESDSSLNCANCSAPIATTDAPGEPGIRLCYDCDTNLRIAFRAVDDLRAAVHDPTLTVAARAVMTEATRADHAARTMVDLTVQRSRGDLQRLSLAQTGGTAISDVVGLKLADQTMGDVVGANVTAFADYAALALPDGLVTVVSDPTVGVSHRWCPKPRALACREARRGFDIDRIAKSMVGRLEHAALDGSFGELVRAALSGESAVTTSAFEVAFRDTQVYATAAERRSFRAVLDAITKAMLGASEHGVVLDLVRADRTAPWLLATAAPDLRDTIAAQLKEAQAQQAAYFNGILTAQQRAFAAQMEQFRADLDLQTSLLFSQVPWLPLRRLRRNRNDPFDWLMAGMQGKRGARRHLARFIARRSTLPDLDQRHLDGVLAGEAGRHGGSKGTLLEDKLAGALDIVFCFVEDAQFVYLDGDWVVDDTERPALLCPTTLPLNWFWEWLIDSVWQRVYRSVMGRGSRDQHERLRRLVGGAAVTPVSTHQLSDAVFLLPDAPLRSLNLHATPVREMSASVGGSTSVQTTIPPTLPDKTQLAAILFNVVVDARRKLREQLRVNETDTRLSQVAVANALYLEPRTLQRHFVEYGISWEAVKIASLGPARMS